MSQDRPHKNLQHSLAVALQKTSAGRKALLKYQEFKQNREARRVSKNLADRVRQSESRHESVREWWDECHSASGDLAFYLTGSSGPDVWSSLKLEKRIAPGQVVLNIGVGHGFCTRALSELGCKVHALDISPVALAKISDSVEATWLPSQLKEIPSDTFDLAISHLVAQHMSDADLSEQIREVVRALKPSGVFGVQFAFSLNGAEARTRETDLELKVGGNCRSLEQMQTLVERAGGSVIWSNEIGRFPEFGSGWYGIHIARNAS